MKSPAPKSQWKKSIQIHVNWSLLTGPFPASDSGPNSPRSPLLAGKLNGGEARLPIARAIDMPVGKGHIVMFALRPFWRWQTQGFTSRR
jgi:hypothetical protein